MTEESGGILRRTVLASAWAVPVVAVAAATPALAASPVTEFGINSPYAGWSAAAPFNFVFEAYVTRNGVESFGQTVTFTILPSGQTYQAISNNSNGFARVDPDTATIPRDTVSCTFSVGDYSINKPVTGTPPPV